MRYPLSLVAALLLGLALGSGNLLRVTAQQSEPAAEGSPAAEGAKPEVPGWRPGTGWGHVWGEQDEVGALNAMTDRSVLAALNLPNKGLVADLGIPYSRNSFRSPETSPCEVMTFRSPGGAKLPEGMVRPPNLAERSCAIFISDRAGTQIKGLATTTSGPEHRFYNNFRDADFGGDFGVRRCDAASIPPIVARGVMLDIAALRGVEVLPPGYAITRQDVDAALARQQVKLKPGDVVLFRTGALRFWKDEGTDWKSLQEHDTAGITLGTAKYLVQNFGVMIIGSDTSLVEVVPAPDGAESPLPVHEYLLVEQGVHLAAWHNLERLARDKISEFCYVATTNKIVGATSGFALRPLAIY